MVIPGFHLDGSDFAFFGDHKIDLHMVFAVHTVAVGIEIQLVPVLPEHLGDDVLHDHALVDVQLVKQYGLI